MTNILAIRVRRRPSEAAPRQRAATRRRTPKSAASVRPLPPDGCRSAEYENAISYRVTSVATKPSPSRSRNVEHLAVVWQTRNGAESSNPVRSTPQSLDFRTCRRIARKARVCARIAIAHGPGERALPLKLPESGKTYPGAILLGPRILALDSLLVSGERSVTRENSSLSDPVSGELLILSEN